MPRKKYSATDREKIDCCLSCKLPVHHCNPWGTFCPYNQKYGKQSDPATMMQHKCGVEPEPINYGSGSVRKAGRRVEEEMGLVNPHHIGDKHKKAAYRNRKARQE